MSTAKLVGVFSTVIFVVSAIFSASVLSTGNNAQMIGGPHWGMGGVSVFGILLFSLGMWKMFSDGDDDAIVVVMGIIVIMLLLIVGMVSTAAPLFV